MKGLHSLPDDYRIYHRKTWYSFNGGVREGEADLLLLHPELGMLVLEVKGGRVAFDGRAGTWTSTGRDGTVHEIKDPFAQAQRRVKALAAKAAALTVEGQAMPEFEHEHGVVFPDCDYEAGVDPMRAAGARDRRARPRGGRDGPGGGAVPRLGRGAGGRAAD